MRIAAEVFQEDNVDVILAVGFAVPGVLGPIAAGVDEHGHFTHGLVEGHGQSLGTQPQLQPVRLQPLDGVACDVKYPEVRQMLGHARDGLRMIGGVGVLDAEFADGLVTFGTVEVFEVGVPPSGVIAVFVEELDFFFLTEEYLRVLPDEVVEGG
jgi:hypothetical protein